MCVILDNDIVAEVLFATSEDPYFVMQKAIDRGDVVIYYGGKLRKEYEKGRVMNRILQLDQAGKAQAVSDSRINVRTEEIKRQGICRSNDTHVIALANVAKVGLLCTRDNNLMTDFKCKNLVDNPRGKIWNPMHHRKLIRRCRKRCRSQ